MKESMVIKLDASIITVDSINYRLYQWPPPEDFPVVVDANNNVVSRVRDSIWDFSVYVGRPTRVNFGYEVCRKNILPISRENGQVYKLVVAWWLFGDRNNCRASSVYSRASRLRPVFALCSENGIVASQLSRYPRIAGELPNRIAPSNFDEVLAQLHYLYEAREKIGFTILDREGIRNFALAKPRHEARQTAYIPPRIWLYQLNRLHEFIDDFHKHKKDVEACYEYCLDAYWKVREACGEKGYRSALNPKAHVKSAFGRRLAKASDIPHFGSFTDIAKKFKILDLLKRWNSPNVLHKVSALSGYLSQVQYVGTALVINYSGMRIEEAQYLRVGCLHTENDPRVGKMYLLEGCSNKPLDEGDGAIWVTSPAVEPAIEALSCVARLRMKAATRTPNIPLDKGELGRPKLFNRSYDPWTTAANHKTSMKVQTIPRAYGDWKKVSPNLFDTEALKITAEDLETARLINPDLNSRRFAIGKTWPLAWHQLRRTIAVNMAASGLVSDASLQYQLKHLTRAMSLYYGQGYSRLSLNKNFRNEYIRTFYEVLGHQLAELLEPRFVSPYGESHKQNNLKLVLEADHADLKKLARKGTLSYRETLFGVCVRRGACPYGGVDNVSHCGGGSDGHPCSDALFDSSRTAEIRELGELIDSRINKAPEASAKLHGLLEQKLSVESVLNVLSKS